MNGKERRIHWGSVYDTQTKEKQDEIENAYQKIGKTNYFLKPMQPMKSTTHCFSYVITTV